MNTPPRHVPRFLPTLTEVVRPSELSVEGRVPQPDFEKLTQILLMQVEALVQTRVHQELDKLIRAVVAEQADALINRLKVDLHHEVNKMVTDAAGTGVRTELNKINS